MKKFIVKPENSRTFISMMGKMSPKKYNNHILHRNDRYDEIILMDDNEQLLYERYNKLATIGKLYKVIGGATESKKLGFKWNFRKGDIIKCVDCLDDSNNIDLIVFKETKTSYDQVMLVDYLSLLIEPYYG